MGARSADHRDDQVARTETLYAASDLDDFRKRLVAENQAIRSWRRAPVLKRNDFPVRATEADFAHAEQHAGRVLQLWFRNIDELNALLPRKDGKSLHAVAPKYASCE